jgi:hypothetical protein
MMIPMPGSTSLRLIATRQHRQIVDRLWQLYRHDLSEFRRSMPDSEGLYEPGRLPTFFEDPDRMAVCRQVSSSGTLPHVVRQACRMPSISASCWQRRLLPCSAQVLAFTP